ncbi:heavy-metal-associated domain-containing protein [Flavobacteriaceae bacterium]|nr:heavy-metal-associated domain-containing protein [Flavobacteriaceae bacterium]
MKKYFLCLLSTVAISFTSCNKEIKKDTTTPTEMSKEVADLEISFGVRGNCGMCKSTIEEAANSVEGVSKADWNVDLKKIKISLLNDKTNIMSIHEAIALSGYDTEKVSGNLDAYNNLPGCCQYDHEMKMNLSKK